MIYVSGVLNIRNFIVLCEVYLQIAPSLPLFLEFFYCNKQPEQKSGPLLECGGVAIQHRKDTLFPSMKLLSHPKGWQKSFFHCEDTSLKVNPACWVTLPPGLVSIMKAFASDQGRANMETVFGRIKALLGHGLLGTDLLKCWMGWRIQPNSVRPRLLHEYTARLTMNFFKTKICSHHSL